MGVDSYENKPDNDDNMSIITKERLSKDIPKLCITF